MFEGQHAGARDLVLLNRFYQPSHSFELRLPLRWIAILRDQLTADLAATSGTRRR